ncbi:MAG TPA: AraC family transcriptional regulator, partial [Thermoanaerobaculia bacterium]|nr:AraC family transcriptional regulator [Thermoanaerobaculia bacterium]
MTNPRDPIDETKGDIARLGTLIARHAPYDGAFELRVPGIHAIRISRPNGELVYDVMRSAVCLVAQGAKSV